MTTTIQVEDVRKHKHAKCEDCPLRDKGKYVPSTFPSDPINEDSNHGRTIALIGESPGRLEVAKGRPFIGPSGQVIDAVLNEHGINRSQILVTNAFNCHYSEKDFEKPPPEAIEACRPRLLHELEQIGCDTAITVGAIAAKALLTSKSGITKLRGGRPKQSDYADGVEVVPTFHPAYALRDQSKFPYIVQDVAKVKPGGIWGTWKDPEIEVVSSIAIATKYINLMFREPDQSAIVCDTESGADKEDTYDGAIKEVLCVGVWYAEGNKVLVFTPDALDKFNRRLLGKLMMKRGMDAQNGKYDVSRCLNVYLGVDTVLDIPVVFDTMLAHYCLDEGKGVHGLDYMAMEYLDAPDHKEIIKQSIEEGKARAKAAAKAAKQPIKGLFVGTNFAWADRDTLHWYNGIDVYSTKLLRDKFTEDLEREGLTDLHKWLMKMNSMLVHVETNGTAVDLDYNAELEIKYKELLAGIDFGDAGDINPNSPVQVKKFLESIRVTVDSTNKTTLKALAEQALLSGRDDVASFCEALLEHRGASKVMGTYVTGIRKALIDGIIHPTFLLHGTTSGRPSCRGPNLQNIPRGSDIRRQFVPRRKGRIFVQADYSQAEFRVITWLGQDALARDMFIRSTKENDVFVQLCTAMYGDAFVGGNKAQRKEMRTLIKTMAYGIMYGREAKAIALAFGIPVKLAQQRMREFTSMIPGIMDFQRELVRQVERGEDLVTPFGRHRRFHLITNTNIVDVRNEAKSFKPQSIASDICLDSAYQLDRMGLDLVNIVHDSILVECWENEVPEVQDTMRKVMVGTAERVTEHYVPFEVDVETGHTWGDLDDAA